VSGILSVGYIGKIGNKPYRQESRYFAWRGYQFYGREDLQLSPSGNKYKLENYVIRPLPANSVVEKNISDIDAVGDCIARAVSILKPSSKDAVVAGSAVITKIIEMNAALSDSEMENQIVVEADQYIPYPLDEVSIDFESQELSERSPEMVEVLLAAVSRQP
jgi:type IV pilus assembly protein PilM